MKVSNNHQCAGYWKIDDRNVGTCKKCDPETLLCSDTGKKCPYGGVRDFGALQHKFRRPSVPEWVTKKALLGGRRAQGNNNGYFASGSEI